MIAILIAAFAVLFIYILIKSFRLIKELRKKEIEQRTNP
jgi:hypothetical protein